jgi:hypothetical protein
MSELRSPLRPTLVAQLAELIANGQNANLNRVSVEDRAAIYGAWVHLLERRAVQALTATAENAPDVDLRVSVLFISSAPP